jgi:PKD repeat protein
MEHRVRPGTIGRAFAILVCALVVSGGLSGGTARDRNDSGAVVSIGSGSAPRTPAPAIADLTNWTPLTVLNAPSPRWASAAAYDPAEAQFLLYGGADPYPEGAQTWSLANGTWTNISGTSGINPPDLVAMVYDPALGALVGLGSTGNLTETWEFSGGMWTNVTSSPSPSPRIRVMMTYDAADSAVLLFGGGNPGGTTSFNDTWEYTASGWANLTGSLNPPARSRGVLEYDPALGAAVLFGGFLLYGDPDFNDTWEFAAGHWSQLSLPETPSARDGSMFVYDPNVGEVVLFGGFYTNDAHGQGVDADTWNFNGTWNLVNTSASPTGRALSAAAFDPALNGIYLFGGYGFPYPLNDSWVYLQDLSPPVIQASVAEGSVGVPVLLNVTFEGGVAPYNVSWQFGDGTTGVGPAVSHVYTAEGNYTVNVTVRDAEPMAVTTNVSLGIHATVLAVGPIAASVPEGLIGQMVGFAANVSGGVGPYNSTWSFGDGGVSFAPSPAHAYFTPGQQDVTLSIRDAFGISVRGTLSFWVAASDVRVSATATEVPLPEGGSAEFTSNVTGGIGPYNLTWSFGDGSSGYGLSPSHAYRANGTFTVNVTARDSLGLTATVSLTLAVTGYATTPGPHNTTLYRNSTVTSVPAWLWPLVGVSVAVAVLGLVLALYFRAQSRKPPPSAVPTR